MTVATATLCTATHHEHAEAVALMFSGSVRHAAVEEYHRPACVRCVVNALVATGIGEGGIMVTPLPGIGSAFGSLVAEELARR